MALVRTSPSHAPPALPVPARVGTLVTALRASDPAARRAAAMQLGGVARATRALARRVGEEMDGTAREAMLTALLATNTAEAVDGLIGYLRSEDAALRSAVADVLAAMSSTAVVVPGLLDDPDPDVRILTIMAVAALPAPEVPEWLRAVATTDPHANVVGAAINELAEVGTPAMAADVRAAARRFPDDPFLAFACDLVARRLSGAYR